MRHPETIRATAETLPIPPEACDFAGFRAWAASGGFPEHGRIDYLDGDLEVDMSPEDLYTHGAVKAEIAAGLQILVARSGRGCVFIDRGRLSSPTARLSAEPDVVVLLWESVESGRVREIPARSGGRDRFVEIEGGPDLVVEIVSDRSVQKDNRRLPALYAKAGVRELWRVDARGKEVRFEVLSLAGGAYAAMESTRDGWTLSPVLGRRFRLTRTRTRLDRFAYRLEERSEEEALPEEQAE